MGCCRGVTRSSQVLAAESQFDGPTQKRSCTDVFCLIILIAFLGGVGFAGYLGFQTGQPYRLIYGVDSWGNTCNAPNTPITNVTLSGRDMTDLKKGFYYNFAAVLKPDLIQSVVLCVSQCPGGSNLTSLSDLRTYYSSSGVQLCHYNTAPADYSHDVCPPLPVTPHLDILNRCVPKAVINVATALTSSVTNTLDSLPLGSQCQDGGGFLHKVVADLVASWREMLYMCGVAAVTAFIVVLLLRFLACVIIWGMVVVVSLGSIGASVYCWLWWHGAQTALQAVAEGQQTADDQKHVETLLIVACVVTGVTVIILLVLLVMRKRIALVVQLFREASKAIAKMPLLIFQPVWTVLALAVVLAIFGFLALYIFTAGTPTVDSKTGYVEYQPGEVLFYMRWYHLFGVLWMVQLVFACQQMVIAGAIAIWYFTRDKSGLGCPIAMSMGRLIRYHLGSVAFGSFLVALVQLVRFILAYIERKLKGKSTQVVTFLLKCLQCCLWCFEKFLKFLNKNAYIMIAIHGTNFCRSAAKAFGVIAENALRVGAINSVGTFCLFLSKIIVIAVSVVVGIELLGLNTSLRLCYVWVPLVVGALGAYVLASCFLDVYGMAIDAIFLCFCEDCKRNDGVARPYFMSRGLMEYVENSAEAMAALDAREAKYAPTTGAGGKAAGGKQRRLLRHAKHNDW